MVKGLNRLAVLAAAAAIILGVTTPARAQDVMTKESVAELKTSFIADLNVMKDKFIGLAQAFPQDKYTWRPMEGVRSVSEVLMLAASEGYGFIPSGFGGKPGATPEQMKQLPSKIGRAHV